VQARGAQQTTHRAVSLAAAALLGLGTAGGAAGRDAPEILRDVHIDARTFPDTLTVGDRVTLEVNVEAPAGWQVRFPERLEPGGPAELVNAQIVPPDTKPAAGSKSSAQPAARAGFARWTGRYTLAVFKVGDVALPPWQVEVRADSLQAVASTDSIRLFVHTVLDDSLTQAGLRDLKPQAALRVSPWPWIVAGLAVLGLAAAFIWWRRWRRRRKRAPVARLERVRPAHEVALEALRRLESRRLPVDGKFEAHHVQLSEILRRYLEDGFGVAALEETTEEILFDLDRHGFDRATVKQVAALCNESDLVKFAKHTPTVEDCVRSLQHVRDFVLATAMRGAGAAAGAGGGPGALATAATPHVAIAGTATPSSTAPPAGGEQA
jgi:hypothetical protein